ncbi:MAG: hypothetical protein ACK5ZP_05735, partial [Betaproteobacteria bacterium]
RTGARLRGGASMAYWSLLRHAPWGEIAKVAAKAAAKAPDLVRELRSRASGEGTAPPEPSSPGTAAADLERLRFDLELVKTNLDRLRTHGEALAQERLELARATEESFRVLSARLRLATWLAAAALAAALAALAAALLR